METETKPTSGSDSAVDINRNIGDFSYEVAHQYDAGYGLTEKTIHYISDVKNDPDWVREFRLKALNTFLSKPMPTHWASKDLEACGRMATTQHQLNPAVQYACLQQDHFLPATVNTQPFEQLSHAVLNWLLGHQHDCDVVQASHLLILSLLSNCIY